MAKANDKPSRGPASGGPRGRRPKAAAEAPETPIAVANGESTMHDEPVEPAAPAIDEETHQKYEEVKRGEEPKS